MSAGAITGAGPIPATPGGGGFAAMKTEDFLRVLLSELSNQDPFAPQDSTALLQQLSSLRNIESQLSLQEQLQNLVIHNQIAFAGGMIGKQVEGLSESNDNVQGIVTSVRVQEGSAILELDTGQALPIDRVTLIAEG